MIMTRFLCLLSLLFYSAYSQCTTSHASTGQSLLISISVNGRHVDKIGKATYLNTVENAVQAMAPSSGRMAVNIFGTTLETKLAMSPTSFTNVQQKIQALMQQDFSDDYGNKVSAAVQAATSSTSWTGQRYHVVFAAGIPLVDYGDTTNPVNYDDPCYSAQSSNSVTAKRNNIQQFVALIGTEGTHFAKAFYNCMVEDPSTDIIVIDPSSATSGIAQLAARVCKANGYDVKITEVNPIAGTYSPYIEILNRGAQVNIAACWGSTSCSTAVSVPTGQYYVGYGTGGSAPSNTYKGAGLPSNPYGGAGWTVKAQVASSDWPETVTYGSDSYWQSLITGRTFELRAPGFENTYGANWRMSCANNQNGSPGSGPSDCVESTSSCTQANCRLDGASLATCSNADSAYTDSICSNCGSNNFEDVNACATMPAVTSCHAYVLNWVDGKNYVHFAWPRVRWDDDVEYTLGYTNGAGQPATWSPVSVTGTARLDVLPAIKTGTAASVTIQAKYVGTLFGVPASTTASLTCSVTTLGPTAHPTESPTPLPSGVPTLHPTPAPTHDAPGVMIVDLCAPERCECFERERTCCQGFGATASAFTPPAGCKHVYHKVELTKSDEKDGRTEYVSFGKYGDDEVVSTLTYQIKYHGVLNRTEFHNLTKWTDGYYPSARRMQDDDNDDQGATPSPTLQYGNKLNIQVTPPGDTELVTSTLTIPAGESAADLEFAIELATLKCVQGGECPTTYAECTTEGLGFQIQVTSCDVSGTACSAMYPFNAWLMVYRSNQLCRIAFGIGNDDETLPGWLWWVLLALLIFLLCLCWLVYRYWWSQKKKATELGDAVDELDQQHADNEAGFGKDLDVGDVAFNPMATGVPGMNRPADAFGNELHQRQIEQQNDMVDVQAEIFQVRQDYGQVATGPRKDRGY